MHCLKIVGSDFIPTYCCVHGEEANTNKNPYPEKKGLRVRMLCMRCWVAGNQPQGPGPHGGERPLRGGAGKSRYPPSKSSCEVASCRIICDPTPHQSTSLPRVSTSIYAALLGSCVYLLLTSVEMVPLRHTWCLALMLDSSRLTAHRFYSC